MEMEIEFLSWAWAFFGPGHSLGLGILWAWAFFGPGHSSLVLGILWAWAFFFGPGHSLSPRRPFSGPGALWPWTPSEHSWYDTPGDMLGPGSETLVSSMYYRLGCAFSIL